MHDLKMKKSFNRLPKPIKIKKEKTEEERSLNSMSHYIDDRVELVKQIFNTLKPKTIINLAPDFLKRDDLDSIEELCLNELLGISSKRLLSVIKSTECPSNTESSDDSDVEHKEEHISLEEISSDSEIGTGSSNATKRKSRRNLKGKTDSGGTSGNGHISVLELLELQARARAIRSQLALEPVTKIEVDTDTEESLTHPNKPNELFRNNESVCKSSERSRKVETSVTNTVIDSCRQPKSIATKADRLKRVQIKRDSQKVIDEKKDNGTVSMGTCMSMDHSIIKEPKLRSRSPSPDVITILPEPEIVYISDNSDEDISKFAIRSKRLKNDESLSESVISMASAMPDTAISGRPEIKADGSDSSTETEEGEITECDSHEEKVDLEEKKKQHSFSIQALETPVLPKSIEDGIKSVKHTDNDFKTLGRETANDVDISRQEESKKIITTGKAADKALSNPTDDDHSDIISLVGDSLESEVCGQLDEDSTTADSFSTMTKVKEVTKQQDGDIIALDTSDDEADKLDDESWHSRYLKSPKVNKVLLASRLGKRVRDKIRKNKRTQQEQEAHVALDAMTKSESSNTCFVSKHEEGSIDQYKELIELTQSSVGRHGSELEQ